MGVDVLLYVETKPSDGQLAAAEEYFFARSSVADRYISDGKTHWLSLALDDEEWFDHPRVIANLTCRYWGPGYERGDWPGIYGAIRLLQHLWPDAKICYGGDSDDAAPDVTTERLDEYWAHWLSPDGDAYRSRIRDRTAAPEPDPAPAAVDASGGVSDG